MEFLQDLLYIIIALFCLAVIVLIIVYDIFDRHRFRIERQFKYVRGALGDWAEATRTLAGLLPDYCEPGVEETVERYFDSKKPVVKLGCIAQLYGMTEGLRDIEMCEPEVAEKLAEKLEMEVELSDFCVLYCELAAKFNKKLEKKPFGSIAKFLRFKPFKPFDFFDADSKEEQYY